MTIADRQGRVLGTQPVDIVAVRHTDRSDYQPQGFQWPVEHQTPNVRQDTTGTVRLTYRDAAGSIIRHSKHYRSESPSRRVEGTSGDWAAVSTGHARKE